MEQDPSAYPWRQPQNVILWVGRLMLNATYENTVIQVYSSRWSFMNHTAIAHDDGVLYAFGSEFHRQHTSVLQAHNFPTRIDLYPSVEVIEAYIEWDASHLPDNPEPY